MHSITWPHYSTITPTYSTAHIKMTAWHMVNSNITVWSVGDIL